MGIAISLVALALGYKVFADACKEKEGIKLLGQIIGIVVMIAAVLSVSCGLTKCLSRSQCNIMSKHNCAMMAKTACPIQASEDAAK